MRPHLVVAADMDTFEDEAEYAADQFNSMLYAAAEAFQENEYWTFANAEAFIEELSSAWLREPALIEAEPEELDDYVRQLIRRIEQEQDGDE